MTTTELIDNPPPLPEPTYGLFSVKKLYTADQYRAGEAAAFDRGVAAGRNAHGFFAYGYAVKFTDGTERIVSDPPKSQPAVLVYTPTGTKQ